MEPLFPEANKSHIAFIHEFSKMVVKRLVPERTLLQISEEAEHLEAWMLNPAKIQKEYAEFMDNMVTLQHILTALGVPDSVMRFCSSHPFAIGLGERMQEFDRIEKEYVEMGRGSLRLCFEPPYIGGDAHATDEVNPEVNGEQLDMWRNLRALYTRIEVALEQHEAMNYFCSHVCRNVGRR